VQVLTSGSAHLVMLGMGRTLIFRHQLMFQTAMLLASWVGEWKHCVNYLRCRYQAEFGWAAEALRWAGFPAAVAAHVPMHGMMPAHGAATEEDSRGKLQGCIRDCFVVHATTMAVVGYLLPLIFGKACKPSARPFEC
jgi:hypothetical protein